MRGVREQTPRGVSALGEGTRLQELAMLGLEQTYPSMTFGEDVTVGGLRGVGHGGGVGASVSQPKPVP